MYYVELIDKFWKFNDREGAGHTVIAFYLYLLKMAKDHNDYQFRISDVKLGKRLSLSRSTVKVTRDKLRDLGLIEFSTKNGAAGHYRLILDYPLEGREVKNKQQHIVVETLSESIQTDKKGSGKDKAEMNNMAQDVEVSYSSVSINRNIPDLREFLDFARTLEAYIPDCDKLIEEKYDSWLKNNWKSSNGRLITNWRSTLKNIMPFLLSDNKRVHLSVKDIPYIRHPEQK